MISNPVHIVRLWSKSWRWAELGGEFDGSQIVEIINLFWIKSFSKKREFPNNKGNSQVFRISKYNWPNQLLPRTKWLLCNHCSDSAGVCVIAESAWMWSKLLPLLAGILIRIICLSFSNRSATASANLSQLDKSRLSNTCNATDIYNWKCKLVANLTRPTPACSIMPAFRGWSPRIGMNRPAKLHFAIHNGDWNEPGLPLIVSSCVLPIPACVMNAVSLRSASKSFWGIHFVRWRFGTSFRAFWIFLIKYFQFADDNLGEFVVESLVFPDKCDVRESLYCLKHSFLFMIILLTNLDNSVLHLFIQLACRYDSTEGNKDSFRTRFENIVEFLLQGNIEIHKNEIIDLINFLRVSSA